MTSSVRDKFSADISYIKAQLNNIKEGHFYEDTKTPGTASAKRIAENIESSFEMLLRDIDRGVSSTAEIFKD
ncbi:hypothetical protein [Bacillus safensis]|uniref:hypothetical protein n=1 Tax=Bacillus safensis TaxID=561879 RepID=UPI0020CED7A1|nr:hypothetical protein [Bacillus safensis]MCP9283055.1 hypothetical protein [Bacillus safensis]